MRLEDKKEISRNAFDIKSGTSEVTLAIKPRQRTYKAGPGITINSAASRRDADKRFGMRWSRI